jgi:glycerol uptake facilitator-like aquaporin
MTTAPLLSSIILETCLTLILSLVIFATLIDPRAAKLLGSVGRWLAPLWVGLASVVLTLVGVPLTGAAANPARWFGTVIWEGTVEALQTQAPFADNMVYWTGPILGALLAGGLYTNVILPVEEKQEPAAQARV